MNPVNEAAEREQDITLQDGIHMLRLALVQAECAIKGREHTGFITKVLNATAPLTDPARASLPPASAEVVAPALSGRTIIGKLLDDFSELPVLWGLSEPGALVRHGDVFRLIVGAGKSAAPAAPIAAPAFNEAEFDVMVERGTKAWAGVPDGWLEDHRGNAPPRAAAGSESNQALKGRVDEFEQHQRATVAPSTCPSRNAECGDSQRDWCATCPKLLNGKAAVAITPWESRMEAHYAQGRAQCRPKEHFMAQEIADWRGWQAGAVDDEDTKRIDWLGARCTGASDSERYLPFRVYWGNKGATQGIRVQIDKARAAPATQGGG